MNSFAIWALETCVVTTLLAAAIWTACLAFKKYPAVQHALWLVVMLRFILPPVVQSPWSIENAAGYLGYKSSSIVELEILQLGSSRSRHEPVSDTIEDTAIVAVTPEPIALTVVVSWALMLAWSTGAAIAFARQVRSILVHRKLIGASVPGSQTLHEQVGRLSKIIGIRSIRVAVVGRIGTPFVWFLGRTYLVWPTFMATDVSVRQSRSIIAHELAHIRRRDHWIAWLDLAAGVIWWWNPVFRLVRRKLHESAEMSCDAIALSVLPDERRVYAEMFLQLSSNVKSGMPAPVLGMSAGTPSSFERRLSMILSDSVSCKLLKRGFLLAGMLALAALPTWSMGQSKAPKGRVVFKVVDNDSGAVVFEVLEDLSGELVVQELNEKSRDPLVRKLKSIITHDSDTKRRLGRDVDKQIEVDFEVKLDSEVEVEDGGKVRTRIIEERIRATKAQAQAAAQQATRDVREAVEKLRLGQKNESALKEGRETKTQGELRALEERLAKQVDVAAEKANEISNKALTFTFDDATKKAIKQAQKQAEDAIEKSKTEMQSASSQVLDKVRLSEGAEKIKLEKGKVAEKMKTLAVEEQSKRAADAATKAESEIRKSMERLSKSAEGAKVATASDPGVEIVSRNATKGRLENAQRTAESQRSRGQLDIAREIEQLQERIRELERSTRDAK